MLAQRYDRQRAAEPLLPEIEDFEAHVPATGVVAIRGGRIVAYVAGDVHDGIATVGFGGCAAIVPEAIRDCFAALAADWDVTRFSVAVPAFEHDLIDAWFRLGFGCQFVWGVRATELVEPPGFGGTIRAGTPDDLDAVAAFDKILWDLQALSPSFSGLEIPSLDEFRAEWSDLWTHPDVHSHFVAELDGRPVGHAMLYRRPTGDLRVPGGEPRPQRPHHARGGPRHRSRHRAGRACAQPCVRRRLPLRDGRLAVGQPARVALLAAARLPAAVPPALSRGPLERSEAAARLNACPP